MEIRFIKGLGMMETRVELASSESQRRAMLRSIPRQYPSVPALRSLYDPFPRGAERVASAE